MSKLQARLTAVAKRAGVATATSATLSALLCMAASGQSPGPGVDGAPRAGGIWKAVVPPSDMKGAFDSYDPIGIAAGARIKADCSINWVDPDDGVRYCFSSGTSLEFFLDSPSRASRAPAPAGAN